jgi:hypothetical protein
VTEFDHVVDRAAGLFLRAIRASADAHDEAEAGHALTAVVRICAGRRDGLFLPGAVDGAMASVVARAREKFEAHIFRQASSVPDGLRGAVISHFSAILDESMTPVAEQLYGGAQ